MEIAAARAVLKVDRIRLSAELNKPLHSTNARQVVQSSQSRSGSQDRLAVEVSLQASSQPQLTDLNSPTKQLFTKESNDRKLTQITEPLLTPMMMHELKDEMRDEIVEHLQTAGNNHNNNNTDNFSA